MSVRVLTVGFDGMEPTVVRRDIAAGRLPNLASLHHRSRRFTARNLPGFGQGVFWPSMYTGNNPGEHGRYFRDTFDPATYQNRRFEEDRDLRAPPFWQRLDSRALRTAVIDVLESPLVPMRHGLQVADWMTHDATGSPRSAPDPALMHRLHRAYGADPLPQGSDYFLKRDGSTARLARLLEQRIDAKTRCAADMLAAEPWDLFFVTYSEAHDIGHLAWHEHEAALAAGERGDPVSRIYDALDDAVGRLLAKVGPETTVCVLAGTGMRRNVCAPQLLVPALEVIDRGPRAVLGCNNPQGRVFSLPAVASPPPFSTLLQDKFRALRYGRGLDHARARRRFFTVPHNDNASAIRFNVKGRERCGRVEPGHAFEDLVGDLTSALLEIRNVTTGQPLIDEVVRVSEVIRGPASAGFPDLLASWNLSGNAESIESPRIGRLVCGRRALRTGDHTREAMFMAAGAGIRAGEEVGCISPMDVGATIEGLFGPLREPLDGRALLPPLYAERFFDTGV